MTNNQNELIDGMLQFFPREIKVYNLSSLENNSRKNSAFFLHKHFREPISKETFEKLVWEIAGYLEVRAQHAVYSFFHRSLKKEVSEADWFLSSARLNKCDKGIPEEVVIFSYDLKLLRFSKKRLYRILENDGFFNDNFNRVSLLTKKEKQIVALLAAGMNSPQVAEAVRISVHTVNTHRRNINEKLSVQNIAGLLKFAEVFDLITPD